MKIAVPVAALLMLTPISVRAEAGVPSPLDAWPAWRGPLATGEAPSARPAVSWSESTNIRWKVALPGSGHSSPIVWKDLVFVTTAIETPKAADPEKVKAFEEQLPEWQRRGARRPQHVLQFAAVAIRRADGATAWQRIVREEAPHAGTHADGSWASASPITDGEHLYACFGSHGLYCLDMAGNVKWEKRLGVMKTKNNFGEGASPVLCGDKIIVNWDHEGPSFIVALDKKSGDELWRVARDEMTSWATPLVVEHAGQPQIIVNATRRIGAYHPSTGALLWHGSGMTGNVIPCPVAAGGLVFCMSGFRGSALLAIRLDAASGDIAATPDAVAWSYDKNTPYVPSPLLHDGALYFTRVNEGALSCLDAATGRPHYERQALEGITGVYASPVAAAGRVYITGRNGVTLVIRSGSSFDRLASNALDDSFSASAALVGRDIFLRGHKRLYCIAEPDP